MSDRLFTLDQRWARMAMMGVATTLLVSFPISPEIRVLSISSVSTGATSSNEIPAGLQAAIGATMGSAHFAASGATLSQVVVTEEARLIASDAQPGDAFGAVALDGDIALVGAPFDDTAAGVNAGSVYVFVRDGDAWTEKARLFASDGAAGDLFGWAVALDGETAMVGAISDDTSGFEEAGSVYVFVRSGNTWTEQAHFFDSHVGSEDGFGSSLALEGDTALVGAPFDDLGEREDAGSVHVFVREGASWTLQAVLVTDVPGFGNFGDSVALSGDTALIGAPGLQAPGAENSGSAYVFVRSGNAWTEQALLFAGTGENAFGESVALDGDTAVISARLQDLGERVDAGVAYVFVRQGDTWIDHATLSVSGGTHFGVPVTLDHDTVLVGSSGANLVPLVNVFVRDQGTWAEASRIIPPQGSFGFSLTLQGDTALVGATADDTAGVNAGAVYVYEISSAAACTITGTDRNDVLTGTAGNDVICGLGGDDRLSGAVGNDTILGGAGDDTLAGGPGTNVLDGGEGDDTASYAKASSGVSADLAAGTASGPSTDSLVAIENLIGSNSDDSLAGDAGNNVLHGRAGTDSLNGRGGTDTCRNGDSTVACER